MSNENTSAIVSKVWSFCNPLRDIGVGYGDYLEQLTYLQKMPSASNLYRKSKATQKPTPKESNINHNNEPTERILKRTRATNVNMQKMPPASHLKNRMNSIKL